MTTKDPKTTCDAHREDIAKTMSFINAHLSERSDWGTAGTLGYIREQLIEVARMAGNLETTEAVEELLAAHEE